VLLQMLVDLGMDVYQDEFERSFLQTAAEAYQVRSGSTSSRRQWANQALLSAFCLLTWSFLAVASGSVGMWTCGLQAEAQEFLASCDCPDYLRKAEKRLAEEVERVRNYMDPGSEAKITRVVETELILKQVGLFSLLDFTWALGSPVQLRMLPICCILLCSGTCCRERSYALQGDSCDAHVAVFMHNNR
jgi:Cullin family